MKFQGISTIIRPVHMKRIMGFLISCENQKKLTVWHVSRVVFKPTEIDTNRIFCVNDVSLAPYVGKFQEKSFAQLVSGCPGRPSVKLLW